MNKTIFLLIFLWGYSFVLAAQSFPGNDATWQGTTGTIAGPIPFRQALCGDTTINGRPYARYNEISFDSQGNASEHYLMAVRTDGPLVWFVNAGENEERLLYDFSLEEGGWRRIKIYLCSILK